MDYDPFMRYPKTTQEKRANQEGWHRAKRSPNVLPDAWWDMFVRKDKCWKSTRKTQYYPKRIE